MQLHKGMCYGGTEGRYKGTLRGKGVTSTVSTQWNKGISQMYCEHSTKLDNSKRQVGKVNLHVHIYFTRTMEV